MKLNLVYLTMYMILHYLKYVPIFSLYISLSILKSNYVHKIDLKLKELLSYKNSRDNNTIVSKLNKAQQGIDRTNLYLQKLYYVERYSCSIYLLMHEIPMLLPCFIFFAQMGQAYLLLSTWHKAIRSYILP
jgi:hypothetical protein